MDNIEELELLRTDPNYDRSDILESSPSNQTTSARSEKHPPINVNIFVCKEHHHASWTEVHENCQKCIKYSIESGKLPTGIEVLSFITKKAENTGKRVNNDSECAIRLTLHWIYRNVYPMTIQGIRKRLVKMLADFRLEKIFIQDSKILGEL